MEMVAFMPARPLKMVSNIWLSLFADTSVSMGFRGLKSKWTVMERQNVLLQKGLH